MKSERPQVLYHQSNDEYVNWELLNSAGMVFGRGVFSLERLESGGKEIAENLKSFGVGAGKYDERNGFKFIRYDTPDNSLGMGASTNECVEPINSNVAYSLHWIILNDMLNLSRQKLLEVRAA